MSRKHSVQCTSQTGKLLKLSEDNFFNFCKSIPGFEEAILNKIEERETTRQEVFEKNAR